MIYSLVLFFLFTGSTLACTCLPYPSLNQDFARTPVIFVGRVINKIPSWAPNGYNTYLMRVEEAFKGTSLGAVVQVRAQQSPAACGFSNISIRDRWLIWLDANGITSSCTRTTLNINADRMKLRQLAKSSYFARPFH